MSRAGKNDHRIHLKRRKLADAEREHRLECIRQTQPLPEKVDITSLGVGARIRTQRMYIGLTQKELAKQIGVSSPALSKIESGKTNTIDRDLLYSIAIDLSCTTDYLLGNTKCVSGICLQSVNFDATGPAQRKEGYEPVHFTERGIAELTLAFEQLRARDSELAEYLYQVATTKNTDVCDLVKASLKILLAK